ncbi:MAG: hypothetical protein ABJK37_23900 [Paraglaciecola sp.]
MAKANFNITSPIFDYLLGALFWQAIAEFEVQMSKLGKSHS